MQSVFGFLNQFKISTKIYASFGVLILVLGVVGAQSVYSSHRLGDDILKYRDLSYQTMMGSNMLEDLLEARLAVMKYRLFSDPDDGQEVVSNIDEVITEEAKYEQNIRSDERKALLAAIVSDARDYKSTFLQARELQSERNTLVARVDQAAQDIRQKLTSLREALYDKGNLQLANYSAAIQEPLMLSNLHAYKYFLENETQDAIRTRQALNAAIDASQNLIASLDNTQTGTQSSQVNELEDGQDENAASQNTDIQNTDISEQTQDNSTERDTLPVKNEQVPDQDQQQSAQDQNNPELLNLARDINQNLTGLKQSFNDAVETIEMRNSFLVDRLDKIGPQLHANIESIVDRAVEDQTQLGNVALEHVNTATAMTVFFTIFGLLLAIMLAGIIGWILSVSISSITGKMRKLADGDLNIDIHEVDRGDEVGDMAAALQTFRDNAIKSQELRQKEEAERKAQVDRAQNLDRIFNDFEKSIAEVVNYVSTASTELQATAGQMSATVEETSNQSSAVAQSADVANDSVQSVAAASEELSAAISEVMRSITNSANLAKKCAENASISQKELDVLRNAISEVDGIIMSINEVAEQTNLLALNATIEAARAGEAGKGFAVVASEVKGLANQTHTMTEEITNKVEAVKQSASRTIEAISTIISQIKEIDEAASSVAASIEEQEKSTREISNNAHKAASGAGEVSDNIQNIRSVAQESGQASESVRVASEKLAEQATSLKSNVETFLKDVKDA